MVRFKRYKKKWVGYLPIIFRERPSMVATSIFLALDIAPSYIRMMGASNLVFVEAKYGIDLAELGPSLRA